MTRQQKKRVVLYGVLLSAMHFAAVVFFHAVPTLLMRPEDMIDSPNAKPTWPRYPMGEALERVGDMLSLPFTSIWDGRMSHHASDSVIVLLMVLTSILWGFGLVLAFRFVFTHLRPRHANAA